ncbi:hypothetical protein B0O99DRAFT_650838 [Bisporella sp. PMI_857]|nr:hypothetical protein B0O99DRAFT_650838 [Bisporella sp. PMI_857]
MINSDPVFTQDEKFLILANRTTLHIYSTSNSLLVRSIRPNVDKISRPNARIITYHLSPTNSNLVWIAFADGAIYCVDWTTGAGCEDHWILSTTGCIHMTVATMESGGRRRDVVFTTEMGTAEGWRITANEFTLPGGPIPTVAKTIHVSKERINLLTTANQGAVIVAASGRSVLIGSLGSDKYESIDKIKYTFHMFESTDVISALDVRCHDVNVQKPGRKTPKEETLPVVDVVVGDVKGSIFLHNDLLRNLANPKRLESGASIRLIPRKLHWHRQSVHTVKWSLDGNYIISGGTETVLLLWQLETGKHQFLPHMSSTIQNVVISPTGSSYAVQLAENSAMVLSTAELKPTASFAGIQTCVLNPEDSIDSSVWRVEEEPLHNPYFQHTPAAISSIDSSRLLVSVGLKQDINPNKPLTINTPLLQTFDLANNYHISRQALVRTNITNINVHPGSQRMSEPKVTHLKLSYDGKWLATVDEWTPTQTDLKFLAHQGIDIEFEQRRRREVSLKFWQYGKGEWELVTKITAPHSTGTTTGAAKVLDLVADPSSLRFATIGNDGMVRTWAARVRKRDNVVVRGRDGTPLRNWNCHQAISIGRVGLDDEVEPEKVQDTIPNGCVTFSEDGSLLAAAYGGTPEGLVQFIDPDLGTIRLSATRMYEGDIIKLEFLGQDLISLSNRLILYDTAADEMRLSFKIGPSAATLALEQKLEMFNLAIDQKSQTFALALPGRNRGIGRLESLTTQNTELAIFSPEQREPVFKKTLETLVTALLPTVSSEGYLILDSAAEIYTIYKNGAQGVTALAQPTSAVNLDTVEVENDQEDVMEVDEEEDEDVYLPTSNGAVQEEDSEEGNDETPVVTQQQLSEVFDVGPSFALPPMEELFYQVAGLFMGPPLQKEL